MAATMWQVFVSRQGPRLKILGCLWAVDSSAVGNAVGEQWGNHSNEPWHGWWVLTVGGTHGNEMIQQIVGKSDLLIAGKLMDMVE